MAPLLKQMEESSIPWPLFSTRELADTLAFLRSIQRGAAVPDPEKDPLGGTQ